MRAFIVGGAVRDILLGRKPKDIDICVEGVSPQQMLDMGFKLVGEDFPVFLHPITGDEFALCRVERKMGTGYHGFDCEWEGVTITDDLARRDLTINSMAIDVGLQHINQLPTTIMDFENIDFTTPVWTNDIIDPFGGILDVKNKILRHTTSAFSEDPVRVLRVARFHARFGNDWTIAEDTKMLMREIFLRGDLVHLTSERVFLELEKALSEPTPSLFFEDLEGFGIFPEVDALRRVDQRLDHHPEKCTFLHTMMVLEQGVEMGLSQMELFACLCHDLGKRVSFDRDGTLHGHEADGVPLVENLCDRLKTPSAWKDLAAMTAEHHTRVHRAFDVSRKRVFKIFEVTDAIRKPDRFKSFLRVCEADARGRLGLEDRSYNQVNFLLEALEEVMAVDAGEIAHRITDHEMQKENPRMKKLGLLIKEAVRIERMRSITMEKDKAVEEVVCKDDNLAAIIVSPLAMALIALAVITVI